MREKFMLSQNFCADFFALFEIVVQQKIKHFNAVHLLKTGNLIINSSNFYLKPKKVHLKRIPKKI